MIEVHITPSKVRYYVKDGEKVILRPGDLLPGMSPELIRFVYDSDDSGVPNG